ELLQNMLTLINQINQNIRSNNAGNNNSSGNNNQNENETFVYIPEQDVHIFTAERSKRRSQRINPLSCKGKEPMEDLKVSLLKGKSLKGPQQGKGMLRMNYLQLHS
ncbi:875_t:CDS:2, partial [Acaulospora morrowiae]